MSTDRTRPARASRPPRARRLRPAEARWSCPAGWVPPARKSGAKDGVHTGLVAQSRALEALRMGLAVPGPGFHVFVAGLGGADEPERVVGLIEQLRMQCPLPRDHVFVHNFADAVRPTHLQLAAGQAGTLMTGMDRWVRTLTREIPKLLESDAHVERRHRLYTRYQKAEEQLFRRFGRRLQAQGLELVTIEDDDGRRREIFARVGEQLLPLESLAELPRAGRPTAAARKRLFAARAEARNELRKVQRKARALGLRLLDQVQQLDASEVTELVENLTLALAEEIDADLELASWLGECARHAHSNPQLFLRSGQRDDNETEAADSTAGVEVFEINIVRKNDGGLACPIVFEQHPNYSNLFGTVERHLLRDGMGRTHVAVRPGSLLAADGGFLVLNARDIFREAQVWRALKRTLQTGRLEVHALEGLSPLGVTGVRPAPVPIDIKVVLVGSPGMYEHLHENDSDFPELFKIKAEFEDSMPLEASPVGELASMLRVGCEQQDVLPIARDGLQALIERAAALAGRRGRISTELPVLIDFAREADYFARLEGSRKLRRSHVDAAREAFRRMHSSDSEWHLRQILNGVYQIDTEGTAIGRVNALTVVSLGPLSAGRPAPVSAVVSAGDETYLNVERDIDLSGPIHNKGVLMLESFMRHRYGQERSLPIKVSLTFDQNYGPIDGDSASSTELYALLSALTQLPIRQDIAVTGAVDMRGKVMAIGGIESKVRGFWELCKARGFTGEQGVMLPASNVADLMLDPEIVEDIRAGKFHLWAIDHVDAGIALLTGQTPAAVRKKVEQALEEFDSKNDDKDGKEEDGKDAKASRKKKSKPKRKAPEKSSRPGLIPPV
jgi:predicted ATP-dependent protease